MRFSRPTGGNSTKSSDSQLPLLEFNWMGDSLLGGTAQWSITTHPSGRNGGPRRFLVLVTVYSIHLNWLRKVLHEGRLLAGFCLTLSIVTIFRQVVFPFVPRFRINISETQIANFHSFYQPRHYYTVAYQLRRNRAESGPMVNLGTDVPKEGWGGCKRKGWVKT